jgi:hypothetical protein
MAVFYAQTEVVTLNYITTITNNLNARAYTALRANSFALGPGPQTHTLRTNCGIIVDLVGMESLGYVETDLKPIKPVNIPVTAAWVKFIIYLEKVVRRQTYGTITLTFILKNNDPLLNTIRVVCMRRDRFPMPGS